MAADPQVLTTLTTLHDAIESTIAQYAAKLHQARQDLIHINATMELFVHVHRLGAWTILPKVATGVWRRLADCLSR